MSLDAAESKDSRVLIVDPAVMKSWVPLTRQRIFDNAWQAFIVEDRPRAEDKGKERGLTYRYLDDDGNRCAIGISLPIKYLSELYGGFSEVVKHNRELFAQEVIDDDWFQSEVQDRLHDGYVNESWIDKAYRQREYRKFAVQANLRIPAADARMREGEMIYEPEL